MKASQKKRLEKLETFFNATSTKKRFARVIYDASSDFDPSKLKVDAEVVLFLPDNGMRATDDANFDFSKQPYQIFYG